MSFAKRYYFLSFASHEAKMLTVFLQKLYKECTLTHEAGFLKEAYICCTWGKVKIVMIKDFSENDI